MPDHTLVTNWQAGFVPHGTPGTDELSGPFADWMTDQGAADPFASFGNSSLPYLLAYAVGADFTPTPEAALPSAAIVDDGGFDYPALRYRVRQDADDVTYLVEVTEDLVLWHSGGAFTAPTGTSEYNDNGDGTETITVRSHQPLTTKPIQYFRLRVGFAP